MLKWLLHRVFDRFARTADYDTTYLHEITDVSTGAAVRYFGLPMLSQMSGPAPDIWTGAALASVLDGDCGPCAQLVVNNALRIGTESEKIKACLHRDFESSGEVGLGFRFAESAINDCDDLDSLRQAIAKRHGQEAVIAASYAAASCRAYPVMKRGLGYGKICQAVSVDGQTIRPSPEIKLSRRRSISTKETGQQPDQCAPDGNPQQVDQHVSQGIVDLGQEGGASHTPAGPEGK